MKPVLVPAPIWTPLTTGWWKICAKIQKIILGFLFFFYLFLPRLHSSFLRLVQKSLSVTCVGTFFFLPFASGSLNGGYLCAVIYKVSPRTSTKGAARSCAVPPAAAALCVSHKGAGWTSSLCCCCQPEILVSALQHPPWRGSRTANDAGAEEWQTRWPGRFRRVYMILTAMGGE